MNTGGDQCTVVRVYEMHTTDAIVVVSNVLTEGYFSTFL